jgi:asparagine synthase (glutamine-hydrolysing)
MEFVFDILLGEKFPDDLLELSEGATSSFRLLPGKKAFKQSNYIADELIIIVIGDLILSENQKTDLKSRSEIIKSHYEHNTIHHLKGFFYLLVFDTKLKVIRIYSSFLNILPVYYKNDSNRIIISSSLNIVYSRCTISPEKSQVYMIEKLLFNYSFRNNTPYKGISLMGSCHHLEISNCGFSNNRSYSIQDLLYDSPTPWKTQLNNLSDIFIKEMLPYIPSESFALTVTGGFDGRTILSLAKKQNSLFETFSYGRSTDPDILIPQELARSLGLVHKSFILDNVYAVNSFWSNSLDLIRITEGAANISRAHYILTASVLSKDYQFLLTGNFGSELIRSLKEPGVLASVYLFLLFRIKERSAFTQLIKSSEVLKLIQPEIVQSDVDEVIEEVWKYKSELSSDLSLNQKFYMYVFEEVFRKYFGPEIVMQSEYILNRSPFLDYNLIKALLETNLAGVYSNFQEKNPFIRFHGQILYSHILKKSFSQLLEPKLDKGYSPKDFLTNLGFLKIISGYIRRRMLKPKTNILPSYSTDYFNQNLNKIETIINHSMILNRKYFQDILEHHTWKTNQDEFANALSMELYYQNQH